MKITPLQNPVKGERIVGVHPELSPDAQADWHRRLNLYPGRSLSDVALSIEQAGRSGRLTTRGQAVSAGVVTGLEIDLDSADDPEAEGPRFFYDVAAGYGIAAAGEDVFVPRQVRVGVLDLPVVAPAALLDGTAPGEGEALGALAARRVGPPLGELIASAADLPRAGIVVLQPVVAEVIGEFDPTDPCEVDPESYAFEDWLQVDGCRIVFYLWPREWLPLPPRDNRWRNRLAYTIFGAERQSGSLSALPWEMFGVPIGLAGFDDDWNPLFVDRYAVTRQGGRPRPRTPLVAGAGSPFVWQAQMQQLAEQLTDPANADRSTAELATQFRYLPPAGLLPSDAIDLRTEPRQDRFFPGPYQVEAVPAPLEQLDLALEASAALAPFDLGTVDEVQVIVPVPEIWYEPRLLQIETVDPEFQQTIDEFALRRGRWLLRRADVRDKASALHRALTGENRPFPDPDPDQLEPEEVANDPIDPSDPLLSIPEAEHGTTVVDGVRTVATIEQLKVDLRTRTPIKSQTMERLDSLPEGVSFPDPLSDRIRWEANQERLVFQGAMTEEERDTLLALSSDVSYQNAVDRLFTRSQDDELAQLDRLGLQEFIQFLQRKTARANDTIDLGFLRVQTDVYRMRQLMLGNLAGTRLATSPALATIAKGESAAATRENVNSYWESARGQMVSGSATPSGEVGGESGAEPAGSPTFGTRALSLGDLSTGGGGTTRFGGGTSFDISAGSIEAISTVGIQPTGPIQEAALGDVVRFASGAGTSALFQTTATTEDVLGQTPIIGQAQDFRTVTVAERLQEPAAPEAKNYTVASKYEVVNGLASLDIAIEDLTIPGFRSDGQDVSRDFGSIREGNLATEILGGVHDPNPTDGDEAAFFAVGVKALENTIATLRIVEGRVQSYRSAVRLCQTALRAIEGLIREVDGRLAIIDDQLAEARHDVAVARALLAEETQRIASINERRDRIVAEHVTFLAYRRPRTTALSIEAPVRSLLPGLTEEPVPACLARRLDPPPELRAMTDLLRDVPVKWLPDLQLLLTRLDRPEILRETIEFAKVRAQTIRPVAGTGPSASLSGGLFGQTLTKVFAAQESVLTTHRLQTARFDLGILAGQSWTATRDRAQDVLTLGDLIDGRHRRSDVAEAAARRLADIGHIATCLYGQFGDVLPSLRLDWAQRLSQFDAPINLRNLAVLPRWGEIDVLDRREMQTLVDWLYQRVDPHQADAVALINDLVRVCILLASHAPVSQIIAGQVPQPTVVRPGSRIDLGILTAHLPKVRVGMQVLMYTGNQVVARGVVEDLAAGQAATRVTQTSGASVNLDQNAVVQFAETEALARNPLAPGGVSSSLSPFTGLG